MVLFYIFLYIKVKYLHFLVLFAAGKRTIKFLFFIFVVALPPSYFIGIKESKELHFYEVWLKIYSFIVHFIYTIKLKYLHFHEAYPKG